MSFDASDLEVRGHLQSPCFDKQEKSSFDDVTHTNDAIHRATTFAEGEQEQLPLGHHLGGTKRNIKSRHAQMMAIGGAIGTSLFLGTGRALAIGGPAFLFLAYCKQLHPLSPC